MKSKQLKVKNKNVPPPLQLSKYEAEVNTREKAGEEKIRAVEEILKQTEEDADKVKI